MTDPETTAQAEKIFDYYQKVFSKALGQQLDYVLSAGLRTTIEHHITHRGIAFVKRAVDNFARSDFHLGRGDRSDGTVYCEPTRVFSDANIDKFGNQVTSRKGVVGQVGNAGSQYALTAKAGIDKLIIRRDQWPRYVPSTLPPEQPDEPEWLHKRRAEESPREKEYHWDSLNDSIFKLRALLDEYLDTGVEPRHVSKDRIQKLKEMTEDGDANDSVFN